MKIPNSIKSAVSAILIGAMLPGCMSSGQDQFGYAAMKGNVASVRQHHQPGFARMRITESNGQKSVPIQYAIIQNNKDMATFLVKNGCHKSIDGRNLTYYAARNGYPSMARHFASLGEGSYSDISKAAQDKKISRQRSEQGALIALGLLAMMMSSGGGGSSHDGGMTDAELVGSLKPSHGGTNPNGF